MEHIAAIDIGSNSFYLATALVKSDTIGETDRQRRRVRLGLNMADSGAIDEKSIEKGLRTLVEFKQTINAQNIIHLVAAGTAALRDATNAQLFIDKAQSILGVEIRILSGEQEAELIIDGVRLRQPTDFGQNDNLVIDIGGCSSELAIGSDKHNTLLTSVSTGVLCWIPELHNMPWSLQGYLSLVVKIQQDIHCACAQTKGFYFAQTFVTSGCWQVIDDVKNHLQQESINKDTLVMIRHWMLSYESASALRNIDITIERLDILPIALAIAEAFFNELDLKHVIFSEANLQDGLLVQALMLKKMSALQ